MTIKQNLPIVLSILLYILIYIIRYKQGGWDIDLDLYPNLRELFSSQIDKLLPSPQAQLLSGILLGQNNNLPASLTLALRDSSTLHIVVASGQNLTMVAALFLGLSGVIKRKTAIILSLFSIIFYTLLTGAQIPVLRAGIMAIISFSAVLLGRQKSGIWALIVTAGVFLLINPHWIFSLSFQLSFLATFGVISISVVIEKIFKFMPRIIRIDLAVTIGAQIMVMPVIAENFHQFSLVSIPANLLVGWTIPFIMIFGTVTLILSFASMALAQVASVIVLTMLTYFIYIVDFFAGLSFSWIYVGEKGWMVWLGYYMIVWAIMLLLSYDKKTYLGRS